MRSLDVGIFSGEGTPDSIPNSAVKFSSADDTWGYPWESKSMPTLRFLFFVYNFDMTIRLLILVALLAGIGSTVFAFQNNQLVTVFFWRYEFEASVAMLVIGSLAIGFVLSLLITLPSQMWMRAQLFGLRMKLRGLEGKVDKKSASVEQLKGEVEEKKHTLKNLEQDKKAAEKEAEILEKENTKLENIVEKQAPKLS